ALRTCGGNLCSGILRTCGAGALRCVCGNRCQTGLFVSPVFRFPGFKLPRLICPRFASRLAPRFTWGVALVSGCGNVWTFPGTPRETPPWNVREFAFPFAGAVPPAGLEAEGPRSTLGCPKRCAGRPGAASPTAPGAAAGRATAPLRRAKFVLAFTCGSVCAFTARSENRRASVVALKGSLPCTSPARPRSAFDALTKLLVLIERPRPKSPALTL